MVSVLGVEFRGLEFSIWVVGVSGVSSVCSLMIRKNPTCQNPALHRPPNLQRAAGPDNLGSCLKHAAVPETLHPLP